MANQDHRMRDIVIKLSLVGLSTLLSIAMLELFAKVYPSSQPVPPTEQEARSYRYPPYHDADYFSPEFVKEKWSQPGNWHIPPGTSMIIPSNYSGKFFNVRDNRRVTTDQPTNPTNHVHVFGGSTVYCSEVPDSLTLPSHLQRLFSARFGSRFAVVNYGTTTVKAKGQTERLETVKLQTGDIVIFYDGVNDVFQSVFHGAPRESIAEHNARIRASLSLLQRIFYQLTPYSNFVRRFLNPIDNSKEPTHFRNNGELQGCLSVLEVQYRDALLRAAEFTKNQHGTFIHFLQPNLFTLNRLSPNEQSMTEGNPDPRRFMAPGMHSAFKLGYPILRRINSELSEKHGIPSFDISDALDKRDGYNEEYYLDICHVNHKANERVAQRIFDTLLEKNLIQF